MVFGYDSFMLNGATERSSENQGQRPTWHQVCTAADGSHGAHVRFHYRPLPPSFITKLAWRYGYHTWMELLDSEGSSFRHESKLVWGVYEGRYPSGPKQGEHNGVAEAKWMIWEYEEDGGLERWGRVGSRGHGFIDIELPDFTEEDFDQVTAMVFDDFKITLGPYGYLLPWLGPILGVWNCQRYVRVFCREHGGPKGIFHELARRYWRGVD